jgi:hypothetical protein
VFAIFLRHLFSKEFSSVAIKQFRFLLMKYTYLMVHGDHLLFILHRWVTGELTLTVLKRALMTGHVVLLAHSVLRLHCLHHLRHVYPTSTCRFWWTDCLPTVKLLDWPDFCSTTIVSREVSVRSWQLWSLSWCHQLHSDAWTDTVLVQRHLLPVIPLNPKVTPMGVVTHSMRNVTLSDVS